MLHLSLGLQPVLAMPSLSEMWPILAIVLLLFGGKKLPGLARSMGASIDQFKKGLKESQKEVDEVAEAARLEGVEETEEKQD